MSLEEWMTDSETEPLVDLETRDDIPLRFLIDYRTFWEKVKDLVRYKILRV